MYFARKAEPKANKRVYDMEVSDPAHRGTTAERSRRGGGAKGTAASLLARAQSLAPVTARNTAARQKG